MKDALLVIDVVSEFQHEDGERLLSSFRQRLPVIAETIATCRGRSMPVVYANDYEGHWDSDASRIVRDALAGIGGDVAAALAPRESEPFILKPRYSAFDHTALELLLRELRIERLLLAGGTTEGCIVQTGIDARELGLKVTIVAGACTTIDEALETIALTYARKIAGMHVVDSIAELYPTDPDNR